MLVNNFFAKVPQFWVPINIYLLTDTDIVSKHFWVRVKYLDIGCYPKSTKKIMPGVQSWKKIPKIPKTYFETYQCSVVKRSEIKLFQVQAACNSENGSIYSSYRFNFRTSIVRLFAIMITLDSVLNSSCFIHVFWTAGVWSYLIKK